MLMMKDNIDQVILQDKIKLLEKNASSLLERLKMARLDGDISENADFTSIKEEYENSQKLIFSLNYILRQKQYQPSQKLVVTYCREKQEQTMQLVDEWEADPTQGKLSKTSPLGKTLAEGEEGQKYLVVTEKTNYWIKIIRKLIVNSK